MQLSPHFSLEELVASDTAKALGIDNTAPPPIVARLTSLAAHLELVRALLGQPMHIDSGYRCARLNVAVRGAANSAHMDGDAADFIAPGFGTPQAIAFAIKQSGIRFDQLILEGTWVHISFAPTMRQQVMTSPLDANGHHSTYVPGLRMLEQRVV